MRFSSLGRLGMVLGAGVPLSLAQPAYASFSGPSQIQIDGGPIGPLQLSGGFDGYGYALNNSLEGNKSAGVQLGNALIEVQKSTGMLQFTIELGAYTATTLGYAPGAATPAGPNDFAESPLYAGFVTFDPNSHVSISAGQLNSLEGYEGAQDWNNYNVLTTELFYVENGQARGVQLSGTEGKFSGSVSITDGYYTKVVNYLQFLVTYAPDQAHSLNIFGGTNLGTTGPNVPGIGSLLFNNSTMIGAFYTYTNGNLTLTPEVQYQYTGALDRYAASGYRIGDRVSNIGLALFGDYQFGEKNPWSVGAFAEYASESYNRNAIYTGVSPDYFGFGPGSDLFGFSVTPTWQYRDVFARADAGFIHVNPGTGGSAFGANGFSRNQFTGLLEAGILF